MSSFFKKKPKEPEIPPPVLAEPTPNKPHILLGLIYGATDKEQKAIIEGIRLLNKVLESENFRHAVMSEKFTETKGMSNQDIYNLFCKSPVSIDVEVFMGSWRQNHISKTVGYEDENEPGKVYVNRYFVQTPFQFASNIIHEALGHGLGFSHYGYKYTSVPYILNDIFEAVYYELNL